MICVQILQEKYGGFCESRYYFCDDYGHGSIELFYNGINRSTFWVILYVCSSIHGSYPISIISFSFVYFETKYKKNTYGENIAKITRTENGNKVTYISEQKILDEFKHEIGTYIRVNKYSEEPGTIGWTLKRLTLRLGIKKELVSEGIDTYPMCEMCHKHIGARCIYCTIQKSEVKNVLEKYKRADGRIQKHINNIIKDMKLD